MASDSSAAKIAQLEAQGTAIRALKQSGAPKEEILQAVAILNTLKVECQSVVITRLATIEEQLASASDSPSAASQLQDEAQRLRNLLPTAAKQAKEKQLKKTKKSRAAAERKKFDRKLFTDTVRTQRKIHHLLSHTGSGDTFVYHRELAGGPASAFRAGEEVFLTEKWDGTTVQATCDGIFKRKELLQRGSSAKFECKGEAERYDVERINLEDPAHKYIAAACSPYMDIFASFPKGLCVYFEAVGSRIAGSKQRFCQGVRPISQASCAPLAPGGLKVQQGVGYTPYPAVSRTLHGDLANAGTPLEYQNSTLPHYLPLPPTRPDHLDNTRQDRLDTTSIASGRTGTASASSDGPDDTDSSSAATGTTTHFGESLLQLSAIIAKLDGAAQPATKSTPAAADAPAAVTSKVAGNGFVDDSGDWSEIRVFDFARNKFFVPFEEAIRLANEFNLPLVGFKRQRMPELSVLLQSLLDAAAAEERHAKRAHTAGKEPHVYQLSAEEKAEDDRLLYSDVAAEMEGYVLRLAGDGDTVAKVRVEDMGSLT